MSFWELLALVSAMATIMGVFLAVYAVINNRTLKSEFGSTREILVRIEQGQNETRKDMAEARKEMAEARREMAEAIRYLADLIRAEGERTRQVVRAPS